MSKLSEKLQARLMQRPTLSVNLGAILGDASIGHIKMWPLSVDDETSATEASFKFRQQLLAGLPPAHAERLLESDEVIRDTFITERVWRACRDAENTEQPAFPSAHWMRQQFTWGEMKQLAALFGRAQEMGRKTPRIDTQEAREQLADAVGTQADTRAPDSLLMALERAEIVDLFVWACVERMKLKERDVVAQTSAE